MSVTVNTLSGVSITEFVDSGIVNDQGAVLFDTGYDSPLWQNGKVTSVPLAYAIGLNDLGEVVGNAYTGSSFTLQAASWQNGTIQALPSLGGTVTQYSEQANAVNDSGEVVGVSAAPGGLIEACLWQNGQAIALGVLPGGTGALTLGYSNSAALAINQSGQIVGFSMAAGDFDHAVLWQNGTMTDLGTLGQYDSSMATAISNKGEVAGYDLEPNYNEWAVVWQNGVMTKLGSLPGRTYNAPNAINDSGIVVGSSGYVGDATSNHPVMWENGQVIDLNTILPANSGWVISEALSINDSGEIVGVGSYNGQSVGYAMMVSGATTVIGVSVQTALATNSGPSVEVVDSTANVVGSLDALQTALYNGKLTSISFTDASPQVNLTVAELINDVRVLGVMQGNFAVSVPSSLTAQQAAYAAPLAAHLTAAVSVSDDGYDVGQNADGLETLAKAGKLGSIELDQGNGVPIVSVETPDLFSDGDVLSHIQGAYQLQIAEDPSWISKTLDQIEPLVVSGEVHDISLLGSSGIPALSLTSDQLTSDSAALGVLDQMAILAITPSSGAATIAGVAGDANVVGFSGDASRYTIVPDGNGVGFVITGPGVVDKISNVTALEFTDHTIFIASQTPAATGAVSSAQVVDLYAAVLARAPDVGGLAYYEAEAQQNPQLKITDLAQNFLNSPEYTGNTAHNYAQTADGDAKFITDTYSNLLHRAPEAGAVAWYQTNVIDPVLAAAQPGTAAYTRAELMAHAVVLDDFSESQEFLGDVSVTSQHPADAQHWLALI
jgi:probable HAF family extracellular repeat protein